MILKARDLVETLHQQIKSCTTGTPAQLAQRLGISHRTLMRYFAQLRELDADIRFCRHRNTYYYSEPVTFQFGFKPVVTNDDNPVGNGEGE